MDTKFEYCQGVALESKMDELEAEKKKELSHLELYIQMKNDRDKTKNDGDEELHAQYRVDIEEEYSTRLRALHEQKANLGKKNVEVYALGKRKS